MCGLGTCRFRSPGVGTDREPAVDCGRLPGHLTVFAEDPVFAFPERRVTRRVFGGANEVFTAAFPE